MGPFTFKGTMLPNSASGGGNNHAGVVQYKNNWYVFYHDRKLRATNGVSGGEYRSVSVDKLEYSTDGTMKQVVSTVAGPAQLKNLNPYDTILATTIYKQSGTIKTAICSAKNPGAVGNSDKTSTTDANDPGTAGDRCVMLTSIANNNWVSLKGVDFATGAAKFVVRAASASAGGSIEIRTGGNTGTLAGTCNIGATGSITTWEDIECDVSVSAGVKDSLTLVFKGTGTDQFRVSKYIFKASGSTPSSSSTTPSSSSVAQSSSSSIAQSSSSIVPSSSSSATPSSSSVDNPTLITNHSLLATHSPTYYSLKGEPLGNAKPQKAGIYIVKQGNSIQKIAVK
jgi:arabinoxylan arabinofuranohydrolase